MFNKDIIDVQISLHFHEPNSKKSRPQAPAGMGEGEGFDPFVERGYEKG